MPLNNLAMRTACPALWRASLGLMAASSVLVTYVYGRTALLRASLGLLALSAMTAQATGLAP